MAGMRTAISCLAVAGAMALGSCSRAPTPSPEPSSSAATDTGAEKARIAEQMNTCIGAQQNFQNGQIQRASANPDYIMAAYDPPAGCTGPDVAQLAKRSWQLDIADARARGDTRDACEIEPIRGCDSSQEHDSPAR